MKKKNILNLIRAYSEKNDAAFRNEALNIANIFYDNGDIELSNYIVSLMTNGIGNFTPQNINFDFQYLNKLNVDKKPLPLPQSICDDIVGMINAIHRNLDINKFIFYGKPGTGKTETAKHVARILERDLYRVNLENVVDSKLGQTAKNISDLFKEINEFPLKDRIIILFDELDGLILNRNDSKDLREMGRAMSVFLKCFDELDSSVTIIATTNLYKEMDKALVRRFDSSINFDRYTREDLLEIAILINNTYLDKIGTGAKDTRLLKKIINLFNEIPSPAELNNLIKTSIAFSNVNDDYDYFRLLIKKIIGRDVTERYLLDNGFTYREIGRLKGVSSSKVFQTFGKVDK